MSPFYLKRHPEEREAGDISYIQQMSEGGPSPDGDELAAVENVFEKHMGTFDRLLSRSDASQQLAQVKHHIKETTQRKIAEAKNSKQKQLADYIQTQEKQSEGLVVEQQPERAHSAPLRKRHSHRRDQQLFQAKMNNKADVAIVEEPLPKVRSFSSAAQTKNEEGDYSREAKAVWHEDEDNQARMMDKIAMMETALLAMNRKIEKLQTEKKTEEDQIQLLEMKLNEVEQHSHAMPGKEGAEDHMNLQLDAKISNLKSSISNMFVRNQDDLVQVDSSMRAKALSEISELSTTLKKAKQTVKDTDASDDDDAEPKDQKPVKGEAQEVPCDQAAAAKAAEEAADAALRADDTKRARHEEQELQNQYKKIVNETKKADENLSKIPTGAKEQVAAKLTNSKAARKVEKAQAKQVRKDDKQKQKKAEEDAKAAKKVEAARARDRKR